MLVRADTFLSQYFTALTLTPLSRRGKYLAQLPEVNAGYDAFCSVRDFQLKHATDLVEGKDLFLVISPGMGKTLVIHAPLLVAHHRGETGIALIIVPTKLLAEQQVSSVTTISVIVD